MLDSDRRESVARARALLDALQAELDPLVETLRNMHAGYPSGKEPAAITLADDEDDSTLPPPNYNDRTGESATDAITSNLSSDPARKTLNKVDQLVTKVMAMAGELDSIREDWLHPRVRDQVNVGDPGCEVVAKAGSWEAVHVTSDVSGNLPKPMRLGQWAYAWVRRHGRLPTQREIRDHLEGRKVRVKA